MKNFKFRVSSFKFRVAGAILFLAAVSALPTLAEWKSIGPAAQVSKLPNGAEITAGTARVRITAVRDSVIRVHIAPSGAPPPSAQDFSWAVLPEARQWTAPMQMNQSANAAFIELSTGEVTVRVEKSPLRISFRTRAGEVISQEPIPVAYNGTAFQIWKSMPENEHYYGLGD